MSKLRSRKISEPLPFVFSFSENVILQKLVGHFRCNPPDELNLS